jgi:hypothetical protein
MVCLWLPRSPWAEAVPCAAFLLLGNEIHNSPGLKLTVTSGAGALAPSAKSPTPRLWASLALVSVMGVRWDSPRGTVRRVFCGVALAPLL